MSNQNRENKEISEQELSLETLDDQIKQIEEEMQIKRIKLNAFKKERKKNLYKNAKKTKFVCSVCGKSLADKAALKHHEYNICGKEEWKCGFCVTSECSLTFLFCPQLPKTLHCWPDNPANIKYVVDAPMVAHIGWRNYMDRTGV